MKALLVVAHGSRREASNREVMQLTGRLEAIAKDYDQVKFAFLELAEPSIPEGLRGLVKSGIDEIIVLPYFLSAGRHVVEDIPGEIQIVQQEYPEIRIRIAAYLGENEAVPGILLSHARKTDQ
ncbi:MAG: sirohydrochlorin ferrochelatase [Parasphingorhabdus sp.]|jgi:sirohydrochlorin ferrochelatase